MRPPDKRRSPLGDKTGRASEKHNAEQFGFSENTPLTHENQDFVRLGIIANEVVIAIGRKCIAKNLAAGDLQAADGIRRSMGASWNEVLGAEEGRAA